MKKQLVHSDVGPPVPPPEHLSRIRADQVGLLFKHTPGPLVMNLVLAPLVVGVLWDAIAKATLVGWAIALYAMTAARAALWLAHRRRSPAPEHASRWENLFILGVFVSGGLWGVAGVWIFATEELAYRLFLLLLLAGNCAGAVIALGARFRAVAAYVLPLLLPFTVVSLLHGDPIRIGFALVTGVFFVALGFLARNIQQTVLESLRLRYENLDLLAELRLKKEEAERANVAKSRFLAAASHDLRQPLHAMALFVSALKDERQEADTHRRLLGQLNASVESLEVLFHALLDVSKLDAGTVRPEVRDFPVQAVFDRIGREYATEAADKGLRLRLVPTRALLRSDATLLERILRNLLHNAIRYTDAGGVIIGCRRCGDAVRIAVCDTGVGIEAAHLTDIFQEFYQIANPERDRSKGLGLGLAIVDRLARLLNHPLDVVSIPGRGSVFAITVPRGEVATAEPDLSPPAEIFEGKLGGALLVVIDDEAAVLEGMREVLRQWGCRPLLADSANGALSQLAEAKSRPAAVIADYRLRSGETGTSAIERIRSAYGADIPGVIITGDTAPDRLREAEASGYHLLHKPVRPVRLRALLSFLLSA
jgi:signal transduction histidine kinase/CheY-like chemotaxis protein